MQTVVIDDAFIKRHEAVTHRLINAVYRDFDQGKIEFDAIEPAIKRCERRAYAVVIDERIKQIS